MTDYSIFPKINATLNGCSAVLLVIGRALIARGKVAAHRAVMITAFVTSSLFLASYLYYPLAASRRHRLFSRHGMDADPLFHYPHFAHHPCDRCCAHGADYADARASAGNLTGIEPLPVGTFPIWLYVSVTGVIVYLMLFQIFP